MKQNDREAVVERALKIFEFELKLIFPERSGEIERFGDHLAKSEALDRLIHDAETFVQIRNKAGFQKWDALPSGFMLYGGGKMSGNFRVGTSVYFALGTVFVPHIVYRINLKPLPEAPHYRVRKIIEHDWAVVGIPLGSIGAGAGGGVAATAGAGLIWGPLKSAKDFTLGGVIVGSYTLAKTVGVNFKAGILHNFHIDKTFPFVMIGAEFGPQIVTEMHLGSTYFVPMDRLFQAIIGNDDVAIFSGTDRSSYPKRNREERNDRDDSDDRENNDDRDSDRRRNRRKKMRSETSRNDSRDAGRNQDLPDGTFGEDWVEFFKTNLMSH
jgi:hypothetical protein